MGIAERKFRERTAMRKLILQAAWDLYLQEGLEHTTMRKIAEKIDYSPTTIYLHYQSKNAILYEMQKMAFDMLLRFLYSNYVKENPYLKLKSLGKAYIEFGVKHPKYYELMFTIRSPMEGVDEEHSFKNFHETYAFMLGIMTSCISTGKVKYMDPVTALLQFWGILHGLTSLYINNRLSMACTPDQQSLDFVHQVWDAYIISMQA